MNKRLLHFVILGVILNKKDSNHLMLNLFRDWISLFKERNLTKPKVGLEGEVRTISISLVVDNLVVMKWVDCDTRMCQGNLG